MLVIAARIYALDIYTSGIDSGSMKPFQKSWYKVPISLTLAYPLVASFLPWMFAFNNADDCLFHSSLLERPGCLLQDGYDFMLMPFKLLSLGGINLVFGLVWYPIAVMVYGLAIACTYLCLFVIIPVLVKRLKSGTTHQKT